MQAVNILVQCFLLVNLFLKNCAEVLEGDFIIENDKNFTNTNVRETVARTLVECAGTCISSSTCQYASFNNQTKTCIVAYDNSHDTGTYALGWIFIKTFSATLSCTDCVRYGSSWYKFVDTPMMMSDAKEICENLGGKLVEVETELENNFLKGQVIALNSPNSFWMGAYSYTPDSSFVWFSTPNEPLTFTAFFPGEPNLPATEFCLAFFQPFGYSWVDIPCTWLLSYVCEFSV